jgi:hypothetical protein
MKKRPAKLVLNRETLAQLDQLALQDVAGGATLINTCSCPTGYRTCGTCDHNTCGTNLC